MGTSNGFGGRIENLSVSKTMANALGGQPNERRLIQIARSGGRQAFDELVSAYMVDIRKFVATRIRDNEIDDVVQDILVAAWKGLPQFDGRSKFRTWLLGICMHKVKDAYRSQLRRTPEVSLDGIQLEPESAAPQAKTDLADAVQSLMSQLPKSQHEVIELYYRQRLTLAEIAEVLDRNLNTVKYQFCQAHVRLAKLAMEGDLL